MTDLIKGDELRDITIYIFTKKQGKLIEKASGLGKGMTGMYALRKTTPSRLAVMLDTENGTIHRVYIGRPTCPNVIYGDKRNYDLGIIDDYIKDDTHIFAQRLIDKAIDIHNQAQRV